MRSTIIVATLAISSLAIPVPQSQLNEGTEIHGCFRSNSPRDDDVDTRAPDEKLRTCRITHPRDVEVDIRAPAPTPFSRGSHPPSVDDEKNVEARAIRNEGLSHGAKPKGFNGKREPIYRAGGRRDAAPEPVVRPVKNQKRANGDEDNVETRATRNEGKRSVREKVVVPDEDIVPEEDIESRGAVRHGGNKRDAKPTIRPVKNQKRADDGEDNVEARAVRYESKRSVREKTLPDVDVDESLSERSAEAEPGYTRGAHTYRRSAEPEPFGRAGAGRREAEPGYTRGAHTYRRSAEPEPVIIGSHSDQNPKNCHAGVAHYRPYC